MRNQTSDSALVYTEASMHMNTYYIIDILPKNAHAIANSRIRRPELGNRTYMEWVIEKAEYFRDKK